MSTSSPVVELAEDHVVVALAGEVDLMVRSDLLASYNYAISLLDVPHLRIDVSRVTFMDSTGCDTLVAALNKVHPRGGTISVVGASPRIVKLLRLTHLDKRVTLLPEDELQTKVDGPTPSPPSPTTGEVRWPLACQSRRMPQGERQTRGRVVQVTCDGTLPAGQRAEFSGWEVASTGGTTVLISHDVDAAALHGTLDRLFLLNMHVKEVNCLPSPPERPGRV